MPIYSFRQIVVNTVRRSLLVEGIEVETQPLIFDLLVFFASHPSRVLTKDELLAAVWRTTFVTDSVVARAVMKARRLIGDQSPDGIIRTVRGIGYLLDAEVDVDLTEIAVAARRVASVKPTEVAQHLTEASAPARGSKPELAVLPFINGDADPRFRWAELGLAGLVHHQIEIRGQMSVVSITASSAWQLASEWHGDTLEAACAQLGSGRALLGRFFAAAEGFRLECLVGRDERSLRCEVLVGEDLVQLALELVSLLHASAGVPARPELAFWEEQLAKAFDFELRGQLGAALPLLQSCMEQLPLTPQMHLVHARLLREQAADLEAARRSALTALEQAHDAGQSDVMVDILAELCRVEVNSGDMAAAERYIEQGLGLVLNHAASATGLANILIARADMERFRGDHIAAARTALRAVDAARSAGDVYREQLAACLHGHLLMSTANLPEAIKTLRGVARETRLRGLGRVELQAYQSLGAALGMVGSYSEAVEATRRAALLATALGFEGKFLGSRIQETFVLIDAGHLDAAQANIEECSALMGGGQPIYLSTALQRAAAHLCWRRGDGLLAIEQMQDMLRRARQAGWYTRWLCAYRLCHWNVVLGRLSEGRSALVELAEDSDGSRRARCEAALMLAEGRRSDAKARLRRAWIEERSHGAAGLDLAVDLGWMLLEDGDAKELELLLKTVADVGIEHVPMMLLKHAHLQRGELSNGVPDSCWEQWQAMIERAHGLVRCRPSWADRIGLQELLRGRQEPLGYLLSSACD